MIPRTIYFVILLFCCAVHLKAELQDGDIVFHRSQSKQDLAISTATHSYYTHVGIVFFDGGKPFVYEAIQPVTKTPLADWIDRGREGHFVAKRLKDPNQLDKGKLKHAVESMMGKNYDILFDWSDSEIYCSELVWKAYNRGLDLSLSKLKTLRSFDLTHPSVKVLMKQRYGDKVPYDMSVVAPSDIFDSNLLLTVEEK